jgi:hypothetical protein
MSWDQRFFDPIKLPNGRELVTPRDAAQYIMKRKHPVRTAAGALVQFNLSGRLTGPDVELVPIPGQEFI